MFRSLLVDLIGTKQRWRSPRLPLDAPGSSLRLGKPEKSGTFGSMAWLIGVFAIAAAAYFLLPHLSTPVMELKADVPASFATINAKGQIDESQWAQAYWRCARELQSRYTYAAPLPEQPPAQFRIADERRLTPEKAEHFRQLYWAQVRKAWLNPDSWQATRPDAFRWLVPR